MPKRSKDFMPAYVPEIMASTETTTALAERLGLEWKVVAKVRRSPKYAHLKSNRLWVEGGTPPHHPWRGVKPQ